MSFSFANIGRAAATIAMGAALLGCQARSRSFVPAQGRGVWSNVDTAARDAAAHDAPARDAAPRDVAASDGALHDASGRDVAPRDGSPRDAAPRDAAARDAGPRDATPADSGSSLCGPQHLLCAPFACDVAAGQCKTFCTSNADCVSGKTCTSSGTCGPLFDNLRCALDSECFSQHCVDFECCTTLCAGACQTCASPGSLGTCVAVSAGSPDPHHLCSAGSVCGAGGGCVSADAAVD
jgi:hypothetical protein